MTLYFRCYFSPRYATPIVAAFAHCRYVAALRYAPHEMPLRAMRFDADAVAHTLRLLRCLP